MKLQLTIAASLLCISLHAQHNNWQTHNLFNNKASVSLPDEMQVTTTNHVQIPHKPTEEVTYKYPGYENGIHISLSATNGSEQAVSEFYIYTLGKHNIEQFDILNKRFVINGDNCYALVECKLKDAYYNNEWYEFGDGSVAPYYCLYYLSFQDGKQTSITAYYSFNKELLPQFKDDTRKILNSYRLVH